MSGKNKNMRFNRLLGMLLLIFGYGWIGFRCSDVALSGEDNFFAFGLLVLNCVAALLVHIVIHEAGHLVAGLCTGYTFVSFRIGSLVLTRTSMEKGSGLQLKRMKISGTGGQCLMCPPDVSVEECPYLFYHMGGGLANILVGTVCVLAAVLVYTFSPQGFSNITAFALLEEFGVSGIVLGLSNLIPGQAKGIQNDGYNMLDLGKNLVAKECMNMILRTNAYFTFCSSYRDLPADYAAWVKTYDFTGKDFSNASITNAYFYQCALYFAEGDWDRCHEMMKKVTQQEDVLGLFRNEALCECLFFELVNGASPEVIEGLYTKELMQYIKATEIYPSRQRLMYAYNKFYKKDSVAAEKSLEKLRKVCQSYTVKADANLELEVAEKLLAM